MKNSIDSFKRARQENLLSGAIKFNIDFVSTFDLYNAAVKWAESDDRVISLALRVGGSDQHALDFRYDMNGLEPELQKDSLHKILKPAFMEFLGEDHLMGWDYSNDTRVIK